ncbi:uncharacterized protein BT62DRAFT_623062 [Guyanagaster necrorhizus]|uniref:Uncharacterized protein n=1 Tax=Guyanagaster necrorhizus TaxID=856835 RepID=A0A9P7W2C9_9AGAR|nr:uncharacterized protein BT62DRAFT_623062 [Guyanagaster necrorhizus MCA 3950]KAG7450086.1 hypothetical protein BT62DRAFT_623062 [Guyanagaster necrorhizus MCA 3950]
MGGCAKGTNGLSSLSPTAMGQPMAYLRMRYWWVHRERRRDGGSCRPSTQGSRTSSQTWRDLWVCPRVEAPLDSSNALRHRPSSAPGDMLSKPRTLRGHHGMGHVRACTADTLVVGGFTRWDLCSGVHVAASGPLRYRPSPLPDQRDRTGRDHCGKGCSRITSPNADSDVRPSMP